MKNRFLTAWAFTIIILCACPALAGDIIEGACACGYSTGSLFIWGGKANYKTTCMVPALCQETKSVVLLNILSGQKNPPSCPNGQAIAYVSAELAPVRFKQIIAMWRAPGREEAYSITDGAYLCPRCENVSMRFFKRGHWD